MRVVVLIPVSEHMGRWKEKPEEFGCIVNFNINHFSIENISCNWWGQIWVDEGNNLGVMRFILGYFRWCGLWPCEKHNRWPTRVTEGLALLWLKKWLISSFCLLQITGNKMTSLNLATIFGPNLLHKQKNSDKEFAVQSFARAEESSAIISVVERMINTCGTLFMVSPPHSKPKVCTVKQS